MLTPMWFLRDLMIFTLAAFLLVKCRPALYTLGHVLPVPEQVG